MLGAQRMGGVCVGASGGSSILGSWGAGRLSHPREAGPEGRQELRNPLPTPRWGGTGTCVIRIYLRRD